MSGLPARFPRASLVANAAALESRINQLMDQTQVKIEEAEDRGMEIARRKLHRRHHTLDNARQLVNDARIILWQLE